MQINQQLVRFNPVLTEEINKKILKTPNVHKPFFSERFSLEQLFSIEICITAPLIKSRWLSV